MSNFSFIESVYIILSLMLTEGLNTDSQQLTTLAGDESGRWKKKQTRMQKTDRRMLDIF